MKFKDILNINKNLIRIKESNKAFNFELASILSRNLSITNKIVDEQNLKLARTLEEVGSFDGYEYIIPNDDTLKHKYEDLFEEDIICENIEKLTIHDVKKCEFDLTTLELLAPMIDNHNRKVL